MFDAKTIRILHFTSINSTNTWAKNHSHEFDPTALTCIISDTQTAGRGQRDKKWYSPLGNLYTTLYFILPKDFPYVANLGQTVGLSVAQTLEEFGFTPSLKWPNDILLKEKKVGGILSEVHPLDEGLAVILGVGLNVDIPEEQLAHLDQAATSLSAHSQSPPKLTSLLERILHNFLPNIDKLRDCGFSGLVEEYNRLLAFQGQDVTFSSASSTLDAVLEKIDDQGSLILVCQDGTRRAFASGLLRKKER